MPENIFLTISSFITRPSPQSISSIGQNFQNGYTITKLTVFSSRKKIPSVIKNTPQKIPLDFILITIRFI